MISADTDFVAEFGWAVSLPPGWSRQTGSGTDFLVADTYPIAFTSPDIAPSTLTWMTLASDLSPEIPEQFEMLTMTPGPIDLAQATQLVNQLFPLIGTISSAEVVRLKDGTRALEIIETYLEESHSEKRSGYHLISPLFRGGPGQTPTFQRLCFYGEADHFDRNRQVVKSVSRSFHYRHPFRGRDSTMVFEKS